jgi:hypothetical protein
MIPHLRTAHLAALLVASAACSSATPSRTPSPVAMERGRYVVVSPSEPREQTADQQVRHVLDRLAFGARPGDVARVREMGVDQWIALQLAPDRIPDAATESLIASAFPSYHLPTSELAASALAGQQAIRQRARQLAAQGDSSA